MRSRFEIVFEIPFNSVRKSHLVIAKRLDKPAHDSVATFTLMMKGAPEMLIELCTTLAGATGEQFLDANAKLDFQVLCHTCPKIVLITLRSYAKTPETKRIP
jgi:magnesium-transporting ATPase (P-type)